MKNGRMLRYKFSQTQLHLLYKDDNFESSEKRIYVLEFYISTTDTATLQMVKKSIYI